MTAQPPHLARNLLLLSLVVAVGPAACAGRLASRPETYRAEKSTLVRPDYSLNPVLVKPVSPKPSPVLVVFASGDGGLMGVSKTVLQHLADRGEYVAGFSSREVLRSIKGPRDRVDYAEVVDHLAWMTRESKTALGLPPDTRTIVTGMSRGANMVIIAATSKAMRPGIVGAVAMALTRELDHLSLPPEALALPGVQVDDQGRPQTYPAIQRIGDIPLAVIQSTNDSYIASAESRKLIGPDTAVRRVYEVKSSGHSFGGGEAELLKDLDDALDWIARRK